MKSHTKPKVLEGLKEKLDKSISNKNFNKNKHAENTRNKEADNNYICLDRFKRKSKGSLKSNGSMLIEQLETEEGICLSKFLIYLCGIGKNRFSCFKSEAATTSRYISVQEANTIGFYLNCNGEKLFRNCVIDRTSVSKRFHDYTNTQFKVDANLIMNVSNKSKICEYLGLNNRLWSLFETGSICTNEYACEFMIRVIGYFEKLHLTDDQVQSYIHKREGGYSIMDKHTHLTLFAAKMISSTVKKSETIPEIKPSEVINLVQDNKTQEKQEKKEEVEETKDSIILNLLNTLDSVANSITTDELDLVMEYIAGLKQSKASKEKLLKTVTTVEEPVVVEPVVNTTDYREVVVKEDNFDETKKKYFLEVKEDVSTKKSNKDKEDSDQNINTVISLYQEGNSSVKDCAELLGVSSYRFRKILEERGIKTISNKEKNYTHIYDDYEFQNLYWNFKSKKISGNEAAKKLGVSLCTFYGRVASYKKYLDENATDCTLVYRV